MAEGIKIEIEELGLVGMIGVFVVPGLTWVVRAPSRNAALRRLLILGGVVAGALTLEAVLDRSANSLVKAVGGK